MENECSSLEPARKRRRIQDLNLPPTGSIRFAEHPCLMLPDSGTRFLEGRCHVRFLDLLLADFVLDTTLPVPDPRCCGSSHGWLVLVDNATSTHSTLFNPLTGCEVSLPSLSESEVLSSLDGDPKMSGIHKIVLSSDPSKEANRGSPPCVAMAVFGEHRRLAFCRIGDRHWTHVEEEEDSNHHHFFDDVVSFHGQFYAVDECGGFFLCDLTAANPRLIELSPPWSFEGEKLYLVGSSGGLLLIRRYIDRQNPGFGRTTGFMVFELDIYDYRWHQVKDLDGCSVFVGLNHSVALTVEQGGLGASHLGSIYFTDDDNHMDHHFTDHHDAGGREVGVYSLDDGHIHLFHCPAADSPAPTWVLLGS